MYALHAARNAIRDQKVAVIVEGYMDAIAAHQWGFANVVASLGTALTETQFRTLQKLAPKIVLALDPDTAGVNAMLRGLDVARETLDRESIAVFNPRGLVTHAGKLNIDLRILTLPDDLDPDELMQRDADEWRTLVEAAPPVVRVCHRDVYGRSGFERSARTGVHRQSRCCPSFAMWLRRSSRMSYIQQLARKLKVDPRAMFDQMRTARRHTGPIKTAPCARRLPN